MKDPYAHIPQEYKQGHCFANAVDYLGDRLHEEQLRLVHGRVTGTGRIAGLRILHAWIEDMESGMCIDPSQNITKPLILPRLAFYHVGKIEPTELVYYTAQEMLEQLITRGQYGPWHPSFDN